MFGKFTVAIPSDGDAMEIDPSPDVTEIAAMDEIQRTYRKRKKLYFALLACVVALIVAFRLTSPPDGQATFQANLLKLACLLAVIAAARTVFRCPNCQAPLAPAFYSSWLKLRTCPKCGVKLTED